MKAASAPFAGCPLPFPSTTWRCKIVDALDGDTLTVTVDRGWFDTSTFDLRLADIDVWERYSGENRDLGLLAWRFVNERCVGKWATLTTFMDKEKYGRILGTLCYADTSGVPRNLTVELRAAGFEKQT